MVCRELNVPMALHGLSLDVALILILFSLPVQESQATEHRLLVLPGSASSWVCSSSTVLLPWPCSSALWDSQPHPRSLL